MYITDGLEELEARQAEARRQFEAQMRATERVAIQAILTGVKVQLFSKKALLQYTLSQQSEAMKNYASTTFAANIKEGFQGKTADKANDILQNFKKPKLTAPIK